MAARASVSTRAAGRPANVLVRYIPDDQLVSFHNMHAPICTRARRVASWTTGGRIRALHDVVVVGPRLAGDARIRVRRVAFIESATYAATHVVCTRQSLADARKAGSVR